MFQRVSRGGFQGLSWTFGGVSGGLRGESTSIGSRGSQRRFRELRRFQGSSTLSHGLREPEGVSRTLQGVCGASHGRHMHIKSGGRGEVSLFRQKAEGILLNGISVLGGVPPP